MQAVTILFFAYYPSSDCHCHLLHGISFSAVSNLFIGCAYQANGSSLETMPYRSSHMMRQCSHGLQLLSWAEFLSFPQAGIGFRLSTL